jgi:hypothetical protein
MVMGYGARASAQGGRALGPSVHQVINSSVSHLTTLLRVRLDEMLVGC